MECKGTAERLTKRLTIQTKARVADGQGGFTETWVDGATVYASVEPMKAYERFQAMQMQVPVTHRIVMRHRALTAAQRLRYGDRVFWIKEVVNRKEESRFLDIRAIERST